MERELFNGCQNVAAVVLNSFGRCLPCLPCWATAFAYGLSSLLFYWHLFFLLRTGFSYYRYILYLKEYCAQLCVINRRCTAPPSDQYHIYIVLHFLYGYMMPEYVRWLETSSPLKCPLGSLSLTLAFYFIVYNICYLDSSSLRKRTRNNILDVFYLIARFICC